MTGATYGAFPHILVLEGINKTDSAVMYFDASISEKEIKKGETVTVEFELTTEDCKFYNVELEYVWEPGEIQIFVGPDSTVEKYKSVELV